MSFIEKLRKPIPVGKKEYAYQCEGVVIEPSFGEMLMRGFIPHKTGAKPYGNIEKDSIDHYQLHIKKFTNNIFTVSLTKIFKDGSEIEYESTWNFADFANHIFDGLGVQCYEKSPPRKEYL